MSILRLTFKPGTMLARKVWIFIVVAVFLAATVSSKQVSGVAESEAEQKLPNVLTPRQAARIQASDSSNSTENWRNRLENKRYLKTPKKVSFNLNVLAQETSQDVSRRSSQGSFNTAKLFNWNYAILIQAANTKFMKGMVDGTLHPQEYGGYMVQDIAYLFHAVKALERAAKHIHDPIFGHFYHTQAKKYNEYYKMLLETWRLKNAESVVLGTAAETYLSYQSDLSKEDPRYLSIGMLPCTMLWRQMAIALIDKAGEKKSVYINWFKENYKPHGYQGSLEVFVNNNFKFYEMEKANHIFCEGMLNELNFFREACGEDLLTLETFCKM